MTENEKQQRFLYELREKWITQLRTEGNDPSYEFNGWSGTEYNAWLEHRHGWPVTPEGWCGPSWASVDDGASFHMEVPYEECPICSAIVKQFEASQR